MKRVSRIVLCAALSLLAGCPPPQPPGPKPPPPSPEQVRQAFTKLNAAFKDAYERILKERGSRTIAAPRSVAFDSLSSAFKPLGMITEIRDPDLGFLTVAARAPAPLDANEWRTTLQSDQPLMAGILCPILGEFCKTIRFEPEDFVIVINATVRELDAGRSEVSLTTRMREIVERPGVPRREYPPPTGVQMALDKIWAQFDRALAERQSRPAGPRN
jgi:hypothetical protein